MLNEVIGALANLAAVTNTAFQSVITTESPIPTELITIEFDYSDVLMLQAAFSFLKSKLLILASYDLNVDIDDILNLLEFDNVEGVLDLLHSDTPNPTLLLLTNNQLADAKAALLAAMDFYLLGSAAVRAETDPQIDDFITFAPDELASEARFRAMLGDIVASLSGPAPVRDMDTDLSPEDVIIVDLTKLFDDPTTDLATLLPTSYDVNRDPVTGEIIDVPLPDETFHGILLACILPGDVDGDGTIDILDAIRILRIAAGVDPQPTTDAGYCKTDLNSDFTVNIQDVILTLRKVMGL